MEAPVQLSERDEAALPLGRASRRPTEIHDAGSDVTAVEVELSRDSVLRRRSVIEELVTPYKAVWCFAAAEYWGLVHDAACAIPPHLADIVRIYTLEDI